VTLLSFGVEQSGLLATRNQSIATPNVNRNPNCYFYGYRDCFANHSSLRRVRPGSREPWL
jgi:hypothetical protein